MQSLGFVEKVQARLKMAGIDSETFTSVEAEPSLDTIQQGAAKMADYKPDWVIGLGGGSPIDAAKAMWIV